MTIYKVTPPLKKIVVQIFICLYFKINFKMIFSFSADEMGEETIEATKKIVSRKAKADENSEDLSGIVEKILNIEQKLGSLSSVENKLDILINKLSR